MDKSRVTSPKETEVNVFSKWPALMITSGSSAVSLIVLFSFAASGWPGKTNGCFDTYETQIDCYCERPRGSRPGEVWITQPANTWSNFAFIIVALFLAWSADTKRFPSKACWENDNYLTSREFLPISYACATAFIGPGSMFMHASLTHWGGQVDVLSMIFYIGWTAVYAVAKLFYPRPIILMASVVYVIIMLSATVVSALGTDVGLVFEICVGITVGVEMGSRCWFWFCGHRRRCAMVLLFALALATFAIACAVWVPSRSGGSLCFPDSWFQGHAIWHVLAAITPGFLFFYYLSEQSSEDDIPQEMAAKPIMASVETQGQVLEEGIVSNLT